MSSTLDLVEHGSYTRRANDLTFRPTSNRGSVSLSFRDTDDVSFFGLSDVLATLLATRWVLLPRRLFY